MKEPVTTCFVRLWNMGVDVISPTAVVTGKLNNKIILLYLHQRLHNVR